MDNHIAVGRLQIHDPTAGIQGSYSDCSTGLYLNPATYGDIAQFNIAIYFDNKVVIQNKIVITQRLSIIGVVEDTIVVVIRYDRSGISNDEIRRIDATGHCHASST